MRLSLFLLLLGTLGTLARASSYCMPTGCAGTGCTCPSFFFRCDTSEDLNGVCTFTTYGVWAVVAIIVLLVAVIGVLVFLICCCCCCRRRTKETKIQLISPYAGHNVI